MKTKKRTARLLALLLAAAFAACAFGIITSETMEDVGLAGKNMPADAETHTIEPRVSDGVTVSLAQEDALTVCAHEQNGMLYFDETKALRFTAEFGEGWSYCENYSVFFPEDSRASAEVQADGSVVLTFAAIEGGSVDAEAFRSVAVNATADELPRLNIETEVPFSDIGKLEWVDAHFTLTLGTKQFASGDFEGDGMVKGRGNSSWTYPKKPYSIKLSKKESLLDIPKTKKYAIVANYYDSSLMRNYITYKSCLGLLGIDYVPKCEFVDVYLNGEYNGVYLLVERIDIEKSKVNIEEANEDDLTGGYLIEKDCAGKVNLETDLWFDCPYWANGGKDYFVCKAPEPDEEELWNEMRAYLENYMIRVHDCLINGNGEPYSQYVDPASWADFIIVQELAKNIDGSFKTSCFMYKQSGDDRLYMTAPWDFDLAYGLVSWDNNSDHNDGDCPPANTADGFMTINSSAPWIKAVYENDADFRELLKTHYTYYRRTIIGDMFPLINETAAYLNTARVADNELWNKNFTAGVRRLRTFLTNRMEWLDSQWLLADGDVDLNYALNIPGGTLEFTTADGENENPFLGGVRGTEALAIAAEPGVSTLRMSCELGKYDFLAFDYAFAGGELSLSVNGAAAVLPQRDELGRYVFIAQEAGSYEFLWRFACVGGQALIDNVSVNFGYQLGDVNMDGEINAMDALCSLRGAMQVTDLGGGALLADVDGSGSLTITDALLLLRRAMGVA